jgi:photosystem II stability/assembly factor-like uncharacterized protein
MKQLLFILSLFSFQLSAQTVEWANIASGTEASFRGLSVVDDQVAWLGGTKGTVGYTTDGGKTWTFHQLQGYEKLDFRAVYAFSEKKVVIANAGSPAFILLTTDGGTHWQEIYRNDHADAFIDGTDFWNDQEGMMYGDPIEGRMLLLHTKDGGKTWTEISQEARPKLEAGEASFAASNTGLRCLKGNKAIIATGGVVSRLWISDDKGQHWTALKTPIIQGGKMTGIFSSAFQNDGKGIIVGGDYERDTLKVDHVFYTFDFGKTWTAPEKPTRGIRECVEYLDKNIAVATGQRGADVTYDGGVTWSPLSDEKYFDVVRKARKGKLIIIAGGKGKVGVLQVKK